jgi:hypothetical protein
LRLGGLPAAALLTFMMMKNTDAQDETDRFLAAWLYVTVHPSLESRKKSPGIGLLYIINVPQARICTSLSHEFSG